jgi:hypothetical protein
VWIRKRVDLGPTRSSAVVVKCVASVLMQGMLASEWSGYMDG